jgi:catechol 2,3-dioxygenase-like lactoylglutathione lyase family enzyme
MTSPHSFGFRPGVDLDKLGQLADELEAEAFAEKERGRMTMVPLKSVVHFSIPVSDLAASTRFYTEIVGCRHLATVGGGKLAFLDAAGTCLILVARPAPINPRPESHGGVHHSFGLAHEDYPAALAHLRAHGVEIFFEEDRQGGVVNGPRAYFRDPDGTVLEFIDLTSYMGSNS